MLCEPVLGEFFGVVFGQDNVPGLLTLAGFLLISSGSVMTALRPRKPAYEKKEKALLADEEV